MGNIHSDNTISCLWEVANAVEQVLEGVLLGQGLAQDMLYLERAYNRLLKAREIEMALTNPKGD